MRCKYLDGVLGPIALFTTMEPILEGSSENLNQCLDAWGVRLRLIRRQAISYKNFQETWLQQRFELQSLSWRKRKVCITSSLKPKLL
jgi:hypothetical protein